MLALTRRPAFILAASVFGLAFAVFVALFPFTPAGVPLEEGDVASRTVRAPRDISFVSPALTERRQDEAAAAVPNSLTFDPSVASRQRAELEELLAQVRGIVNNPVASPTARAAALEALEGLDLSPGSLSMLSNLSPADYDVIENEAKRALASILRQSLPPDAVAETQARASTYLDPAFHREQSTPLAEGLHAFVVPNQGVDTARTEAARAAARAAVAPVRVSFLRNQVVVEKDTPVTPEAHEALVEAGLIGNAWRPELVGAVTLVSVLVALAVAAGLHVFRSALRPRELAGVGFAMALPVFVMKVYLPLILPDDERHFLAYVMPLAAAPLVLAGLVGAGLAPLAPSLLAMLAAFAAIVLLDVTVVSITGALDVARLALVSGLAGAAGVFAVRAAERLVQFLVGGLLLGLSV